MSTYDVLKKETTVSFGESKKLPGSPCRASLWKWSTQGCVAKHSEVIVILEACNFGGRPHTSFEAYDRFNNALNAIPFASNPLASIAPNTLLSVTNGCK